MNYRKSRKLASANFKNIKIFFGHHAGQRWWRTSLRKTFGCVLQL